jgi:lipopolysaccharide/colanic/teichoic acid biosynthesis glycosyltransferase
MASLMKVQLAVKRCFDIFFSITLIGLSFPVFIVVSLIIWLCMGTPILFRQERLGYLGKEFKLYKFRTMEDKRDNKGELLPDEDRLTSIGLFLRSTSLDELPELINVLIGDMSIVGPRPLLVEYRDLYTAEQFRRHEMPPGMAGPVLAEGRNALSWEDKFDQDLVYVDKWSLWVDLRILFATIIMVLKREGISAQGYATMPKFEGTKTESRDYKND